ncbi:MAG: DUF1351 domain-containing protein [Pygmaiobacter sp.]
MELIITTDLTTELPAEIAFNFEQLKTELAVRLEKYNTMVVTEDAIKGAKVDRAALNRLKTALDDGRKGVRTACLKPYVSFESRMIELTGMIDKQISAIDRQIKGYEIAQKEDKRRSLEQFYKINAKALIDLIPLEKIWDERWLNATFKITDAEKQIISTLEKVKNEIGIIRAMKCSCEQQMLDCYLQTLNLSAALAEKTRREEQDKCLMAYQDELPIPTEKPIRLPVEIVRNDEPIQQLDFRVWVTPTQKAALKLFLNEHQIKVGRVL